MRQTYRVLAGLVALGVLVQAAAIAFGWFDALNQVDSGLVIDKNYEGNIGHAIHGISGEMIIPAIGLILLIVSFFAAREVPKARQWAGIVFGLIVLQVALAFLAFGVPALGALHGINALFVLFAAVRAAGLATDRITATSPARATAAAGVPAQRPAAEAGEPSRPA